jgi:hypothetical protein
VLNRFIVFLVCAAQVASETGHAVSFDTDIFGRLNALNEAEASRQIGAFLSAFSVLRCFGCRRCCVSS